jgi:hypothetical protein
MVIGPTPPGTGVTHAARSITSSKATSPTSLPSASRLMPTSMTAAPGFTQSPRTRRGRPTAATSTSASAQSRARSRVREWAMVTVALRWRRSSAIGLPTMLLRPMTTARAPSSATPVWSSRRMHPSGVHGTSVGAPARSAPPLSG